MGKEFFSKVFARTNLILIFLIAVYLGSFALELKPKPLHGIDSAAVAAFILQVGLWISAALDYWIVWYVSRKMQRDPSIGMTANLLSFVIKLGLWAIVLLLILENLGVNVTTLVAGVGISGIAIALAIQGVLTDVASSISIVLDKPFVIGDLLTLDQFEGIVEEIGVKTTRLRSLTGEQIIFPNSDIIKSRLRNFGGLPERRVSFTVGVTYDTPQEKLVKIPDILEEIVKSQKKARLDRVHFSKYGDWALIFEVSYYVLARSYHVYMDVNQAINFLIYERFSAEQIEFATPARNFYVFNQDKPEKNI